MNGKVIGIIGVITVALVVVLFVAAPKGNQSSGGSSDSKYEKGQTLLPGVASKLDDVILVKIDKGTETLTFSKVDDTWRLQESNHYFAKEDKVAELIIGFRNFDFLEQKTSNPDFYEKLGVQDPGEETQSAHVILETASGKLADVILGESKRGAGSIDQRFVRVEGDPHVYLASTNADATGDVRSWVQTDVIDLPPARLSSVEINRWDGEVLNLDKPTSTTVDWELANIPDGAEIANQNTINTIGRSLARVTHEDVNDRSVLESDGFTSETVFAVKSFDGIDLKVTMLADTSNSESKWWAKFDIQFDENLYSAESSDKSIEEVRNEVEELKERLDDWAYQLAGWKATNMTKIMSELIEFPSEEPEMGEIPQGLPPTGESMSLEDLSEFLTPEQLQQLQNSAP